jgi:hypothetical protein
MGNLITAGLLPPWGKVGIGVLNSRTQALFFDYESGKNLAFYFLLSAESHDIREYLVELIGLRDELRFFFS